MKIADEAVEALARTLADLRFVSMVGVTEDTRQKLVAIMGDRPANEVVAELIEERYQGLHNNQVIPEAAVEAALFAIANLPTVENRSRRRTVRAVLDAAVPHLTVTSPCAITTREELDALVPGTIARAVTGGRSFYTLELAEDYEWQQMGCDDLWDNDSLFPFFDRLEVLYRPTK